MAKPTQVGGLGPTTPLSDAGMSLVLARLFDLRRHELPLFHALEMEEVHDARVAARRLRAAIQMFGKRPLREAEREVEALQDALGEVRDLHVQRAWLSEVRKTDRGEALALEALDRERALQLVSAERALLLALKRWVERGAPCLQRAARHVRAKGLLSGEVPQRVLAKALRKLEAAREGARVSRDPEVLHTYRIRLKKFRYLAELLGPALDAPMHARLEVFADVQDAVGALHDLDVRIALLSGPAWSMPALLARLREERGTKALEIQKQIAALEL